MIEVSGYIDDFPFQNAGFPWKITRALPDLITEKMKHLSDDFRINDGVAIHRTSVVEPGVVMKGPVIIGENCFVGAHNYLRGGVILGAHVTIGPGCEIKTSFIGPYSSVAHMNFIGDSIVGCHVNFEAGALTANHYNERENKTIYIRTGNKIVCTNTEKFGSLIGDHSRIGANAVLSPGTILQKYTVVRRLELVEQVKDQDIIG